MSELIGNMEKIFPIIKKRGLPGGCGTPKIYDVAMNSPQSQYETVGAIVEK